jgi:hypothetical protein
MFSGAIPWPVVEQQRRARKPVVFDVARSWVDFFITPD